MKRANIELHIDELVLHGFSPGNRYRIADAVERELTSRLTEYGWPASVLNNVEIAYLDAGALEFETNARPETIGTHVGQSVYQALGLKENANCRGGL